MKHKRKRLYGEFLAWTFVVLVGAAGACSQKTDSTNQESASEAKLKHARIVYYAMPG